MAGASSGSAFEHTMESAIRGYHIYQDVWVPVVNELLKTSQEHGNTVDNYAVAIYKEDTSPGAGHGIRTVIGHVCREISRVCWFFLQRDGEILCKVTSTTKRRSPLVQGGLEIPCELKFIGKKKHIKKLKKPLSH